MSIFNFLNPLEKLQEVQNRAIHNEMKRLGERFEKEKQFEQDIIKKLDYILDVLKKINNFEENEKTKTD